MPVAARPALRSAAVLGLLCVSALAAVYWAAVRTVPGRVLDGRSLRGALLLDSRATRTVERVLDVVSVTSVLAAVGLVLAIGLLRGRPGTGVGAVVLLLGANATTQVLKHLVLSRPYLGLVEPSAATANSLPSGHVTVAFSVAVALVVVLPPALRGVTAAAGVAATLLLAVATMTSGWHRPSDTVAACLVVGAWAAVVLAVLAHASASRERRDSGRTAGRLAVSGLVLLVAGSVVMAALVPATPSPAGTAGRLVAYVAGALLTAGTAAAVMAGVLRVTGEAGLDRQASRDA